MARLRELMEALRYRDVRTYVQSGNVVFSAPDTPPPDLEQQLERAIAAEFGFDVSVVVRSRDELADVVALDPLGDIATDPARYLVIFRAAPLDPERLAAIDPAAFAPEAFHARERELYVWAPEGMRDSALLKALSEQRLGGVATARNWRTVEKLLALADESEQ